MTKPIVVKLGGSCITNKRRPFSLRRGTLRRLCGELKFSPDPVVVVHGGGSFGHPIARKHLQDLKRGFYAIHQAMLELNSHVVSSLSAAGFKPFSIPPSLFLQVRGGEVVKTDVKVMKWLLGNGILPVTFGDVVPNGKDAIILSGDRIASQLSLRLHARRAIFCLDVDGLYIREDGEIRLASEFSPKDVEKLVEMGGGTDVTGGIKTKVMEIMKIARAGIEVHVINGLKKGRLMWALRGERGMGTRIF